MQKYHRKYVEYEKERDVLFVFGAGASIADGAPLQKDILPNILKLNDESYEIVKVVKGFLHQNFHISDNNCPSLESVFGYLDYFINNKESLGRGYSTLEIQSIKKALIRLIHYEISNYRKMKGVYRKFWDIIANVNRNVSIITMNYDTLLDESFDFLYPNKAVIDYCINLMNYDRLNEISGINWWDDARKPLIVWEGGDPHPIKIIKIHGSVNWKYCNCCNQVLLTPWNSNIDLKSNTFKGKKYKLVVEVEPEYKNDDMEYESYEKIEYDLRCPNDDTLFDTFIVPPSHIKDLKHPAINRLLDEAAIELRKAKKIIFVGYSFPEADVHIKALFKKNISKSTEIEVVDPFLNETTMNNYKSLSVTVNFVQDYFENYVETLLAKKIETKG